MGQVGKRRMGTFAIEVEALDDALLLALEAFVDLLQALHFRFVDLQLR